MVVCNALYGRLDEVFSFVVLYMEIDVLKWCGDYINKSMNDVEDYEFVVAVKSSFCVPSKCRQHKPFLALSILNSPFSLLNSIQEPPFMFSMPI